VFLVLEWLEPSVGLEFLPVMAYIVKVVVRQLGGLEPLLLYIWYSGVSEHFKICVWTCPGSVRVL